jgi:hypothetical protein
LGHIHISIFIIHEGILSVSSVLLTPMFKIAHHFCSIGFMVVGNCHFLHDGGILSHSSDICCRHAFVWVYSSPKRKHTVAEMTDMTTSRAAKTKNLSIIKDPKRRIISRETAHAKTQLSPVDNFACRTAYRPPPFP